jgi:Ser/Thr protein kinase RdoA (MazF antagonist)
MEKKDIDLAAMRDIAGRFQIGGTVVRCGPYGSGHINDTFEVVMKGAPRQRYIFQRINHRIFRNVEGLMENISRVTRHLRSRLEKTPGSDPDRETLTLIPARDGRCFLRTDAGEYWRAYIFIEGATTHDVCKGPEQAGQAAQAFQRFQAALVDLPGGPLHETIPYFHHTPRRFSALKEAIEKDSAGRKDSAREAIEFALEREAMTSVITNLLETGDLPGRVTHNDTKLNNVMIDDQTGKGVCVIDLDTVMNGSALYDFGDMVRTSTPVCLEDEPDLSKVDINLDVFEALVRGYTQNAKGFLTRTECEHLAFAGRLITFTIGIRFLTDYLSGDVYFRTHRPGHNLDRARVQFRLVATMEKHRGRMEQTVKRYC